MVPTWNEKDNILQLIRALRAYKIDVLVVDDNSPDGTSELVIKETKKDKHVHLLLRTTNKGRGYAGVAGLKKALELGADYVIEMDADFSHDPVYIPQLLAQMEHADVALGSRFAPGGSDDVKRGFARTIITKAANWYIRLFLGMKIRDCNSGFRCFKKKVLQSIDLDGIKSRNADIVQEIIYLCHKRGFTITEIPIHFKDRVRGQTTKTVADYVRGIWVVLRLRFTVR